MAKYKKGNFSRLTFKHNKLKYLVKCLYAPNKDLITGDMNNENTIFFKSIFDDSNNMEYGHCVMAGDYNVALKHEIDTNGYLHINNPSSRQYMKMRIATNDLTDIWRDRNPEKRVFTFDSKETGQRQDLTTFSFLRTQQKLLLT